MDIRGIAGKLKIPNVRVLLFGVAVLAVLAAGTSYYFYTEAKRAADPQRAAQQETQRILALVGRLMVLPEGETPVIATVADPEKLQGQAFFQNAKKGDKLLIYNTARKAILYDEVADRIVEVAPLSVGGDGAVVPTP